MTAGFVVLRNCERWIEGIISGSLIPILTASSATGSLNISIKKEFLIPQMPSSWTFVSLIDNWGVIYPNHNIDVYVYSKQVIDGRDISSNQDGRGVFVLLSIRDAVTRRLYEWARNSSNVWTFSELRNDNTQPAVAIKNNWPRQSGSSIINLYTTIAGWDLPIISERYSTMMELSASASLL